MANDKKTVSERIQEAVLYGTISPGTRVSPEELARDLGVSHIPVREALRALEAQGHVTRIVNRGFYIPAMSVEDFEDIYRWRRVLEDEAHALGIPRLTADDFVRMRLIEAKMRGTKVRASPRVYNDLNRQFHFVVFTRAGSERLTRFLDYLWDAAARYYFGHMSSPTRAGKVGRQHAALLEAFQTGDVEQANALMAEHRLVTMKAVYKQLGGET